MKFGRHAVKSISWIVLINKIHYENDIFHSSCDKPPADVLDPCVGRSRSDIADILFSNQPSSCSNESHIIAWPGDFINGHGCKTVTVFHIFTIVHKNDEMGLIQSRQSVVTVRRMSRMSEFHLSSRPTDEYGPFERN